MAEQDGAVGVDTPAQPDPGAAPVRAEIKDIKPPAPVKLAGKYGTEDDLVKGIGELALKQGLIKEPGSRTATLEALYKHMESGIGKPAPAPVQAQPEARTLNLDDFLKEATTAGVDFNKVFTAYATDPKTVDAKDRDAIKATISRMSPDAMVDYLLNAELTNAKWHNSQAEQAANAAAGGADKLKAMVAKVAEVAPDQADTIRKALSDPANATTAVYTMMGLLAAKGAAVEPKPLPASDRPGATVAGPSGPAAFRNQAEMTVAQREATRRYGSFSADPDFMARLTATQKQNPDILKGEVK